MNRKNAFGTLLALGLLTTLTAHAEVVFAQANLLLNKNQLSAVNYRGKGLSLPVGTKVQVLERDDDEVRCRVVDSGAEFRFVSHKSLGKTALALFPGFFSAKDPAARIAALTPEEQKQVKAGTLAKGMSRDAVLLTVGPPPPHRTLSLESTKWTYWSSKFSTFEVVFDADGKVVSHGGEPEPTPAAEPAPAPAPKFFHATANFHFQDDTVSWVNYLKGPILPFNTKVEVLDKGSSKVKFKVVETGKEFVFENDSRSGADTWALFQSSFAAEDQAGKLAELSPEDRKKVSASEVVIGMSRAAVRMAWGPPPPHETASFNSTIWTYWKSSLAKVRVTFDQDDKVKSID
ncbi:hypothetical protein SAMN05443572_10751 [Myxococcus fulvus]|uniref:Lipoprotein n=1 Tax=Myxococcus fulvus TaxID=33 RepID=A0A511T7A7_MYXFU|nr:hypothetical protein [Myxococcus fulvus]AKF85971.1 hypothetical protein MFUL124B02_19645 [Myxococcus fulvus 124B02]GEN10044.1 hypothetical protein MFU01_50810 [Myxococcus fulvus]SEU25123.1 hypothetical protein SAMN05443572_10751 [Myxococcus fulvus]